MNSAQLVSFSVCDVHKIHT